MKEELKRYENLYVSGRLDRREFMRRMTALGVASGTLATMLGATVNAAAATPKRGGRLRLGWYTHSANDTLDPTRITTTLDYHRIWMTNSTLVRYSRNFEAQPELAESWEPSPDAKVWHFKLRKGVEFHDGKTLDAEDVISSLSLHIGPDSKSIIKPWLAGITAMKADGPDVVRIDLDAANADLPLYLGDMHAAIFPKDFRDFDNAMGTGPFKLKSFKPGVGMLAVRNENYFVEGRPYIDEVESFGIGESSARTNALLSGDVHFVCRVDPKLVSLIDGAPGLSMVPARSGRHITFPMQSDRPPMDNGDLRKALRYMADREAMLRDVAKGFGSLANDHPVANSDPYVCKELPQRTIDLDKARFHLKKAGMEGATLDLHTSEAVGGVVGPDLALHLSESAKKVGLNINVIRNPSDGYWGAIWLKQPFHMSNWQPRPTADLMLSLAYMSSAKWNEGRYFNTHMDELIVEARGTLDPKKRYELYCEVQRILYEDGGSIIPLFTDWLDAKSDAVQGYVPHPLIEGAGGRMSEEVWLES